MPGVHLHVASAGNEFMAHIAEIVAGGFLAAGVPCDVVVDGLPPTAPRDAALHVVIAPHEYFPLHFLRTRPTIELAPTLASVAVLNVEQPGSEWFNRAWEFARQARVVYDISLTGVIELERRGVPAWHTPLGYVPALEAPEAAGGGSRPIDVLFLGNASPRRAAFFARHARWFARRNCRIILSDAGRPRLARTAGYRSGLDRLRLAADARIVLGVHATERPYFEQHRALLALANRALLVTETSRHTEPLEEGRHFVSAPLDELPARCEQYLERPAELERIASEGHALAIGQMAMADSCRVMLEAVGAAAPARRAADAAAATARRDAVRARLRDSHAALARGDAPWTVTSNASAGGGPAPRVSVVVTLFDYREYVGECLASVADATPPAGGLEIVVVDDASTDGSAEAVEEVMARDAVPIRLVRKRLNTGLADARNIGLELARGARVFMLDADNWIYPSCLAVLDEAMNVGSPVAAYGLIARVDQKTGQGTGLLSSFEWSPERLVEGPYIDAMALLDREAVLSVGGYSTDLIDHGWFGWEDYDLWLKLAQAGRACRLVPRVVAGYRDHHRSMLRRTNRDSRPLAAFFSTKFADLVARYPGLESYFGFAPGDDVHRSAEEREIAALRQQQAHLEERLADVYRSASWTITAPLRAVLDRLRRR